jgi:hypothetical protein
MTSGRMRPLVTKEIRALLPAWFATMCAIGAAVLSGPRGHFLGMLAYGFGSVTLGAQSIGHEYTHRTLTLLLSQPSSRRRLLLTKLGVLTVMLLTLAAFAWITVLRPGELHWVFASILCALFLAPLLTMLCRNPLAGPVFVGAAPAWISFFSGILSTGVVRGVTLGVCVAAAVASWRLFMRLEAIDGRGQDVRLPQVLRRRTAAIVAASVAPARRRHPVWLLVKKELHLQQMTCAVTGVWVLIWIVISASTKIVPGFAGFPLPVVSILYGALLALLIGSLASAEERQIGTLEWQVLLPMATWKQWAVKVGTVLGLAGLLSFGIPLVLAAGHVGVNAWHAGAIILLTIGSLYVSSLCPSGVRALMVSAPVMLALAVLSQYLYVVSGWPRALLALPLAGVVALLLWFALENHRSAGQSAGRVSMQVMWIAGCLTLGFAAVTAFP